MSDNQKYNGIDSEESFAQEGAIAPTKSEDNALAKTEKNGKLSKTESEDSEQVAIDLKQLQRQATKKNIQLVEHGVRRIDETVDGIRKEGEEAVSFLEEYKASRLSEVSSEVHSSIEKAIEQMPRQLADLFSPEQSEDEDEQEDDEKEMTMGEYIKARKEEKGLS